MDHEKPGKEERLRRPEPERTAPDRTGSAGKKAPPDVEEQLETDVHRVIADAVRLGYGVVNENLQQGRAAADRFSAGAYGAEEIQQDISLLGGRLLQLSRDMATVSFDLLGALARDPNLREAVKPKPVEPRAPPDVKSPVKVGCVVKGNSRATAAPLVLSQPDRPSRLVVAGLHSPDKSLPPITSVTFLASDDGASIMAVITVPEDQPAGVYSGVVCDAETHAPLGAMSVQVSG